MPSHLHDSGVDRLTIPEHPHLWVEFKREASFADELKVEQYRQEVISRSERDEYGAPKLDAYLIADFVVAKAEVMISAWNLGDKDGNTLPIKKDSIYALNPQIARFLGDEAAARFAGRPEEKEAPFAKPSRRTSSRGKK